MKRVGIVVGHLPTCIDGGAYNEAHGMSEFDYNNQLAPRIAEALRILGFHPTIIYRETYSKLPAHINHIMEGQGICISLHCNAANRRPNGCETLYYKGSAKSKRLAECVLKQVHSVMQNRNRGTKAISEGGRGHRLLFGTKMPCIIVEPFFIDADCSLEMALEKIDALGDAIAKGIKEFSEV